MSFSRTWKKDWDWRSHDDKEAQTREEQRTPVELDHTQESVLEQIETPADERDEQKISITKPETTMKEGILEKDQGGARFTDADSNE